MIPRHEVFARFRPWRGWLEAGLVPNFLGVMTRPDYHDPDPSTQWYVGTAGPFRATYPEPGEEYPEWIDLLETVTRARGSYTMIELGAGWGRWLVNAAFALRAWDPRLTYRLVGVEAEPRHFQWMLDHIRLNGLHPNRFQLHEAAVAAEDGEVSFYVGCHESWYGQRIEVPGWPGPDWVGQEGRQVTRVRAVSLATLLAPLDRIDLIDLDVQGSELEVLSAARDGLARKVGRVHVGTHSIDNERGLRDLFRGLGWRCVNDYRTGATVWTPWGKVTFVDDVQSWVNPAVEWPPQPRPPGGLRGFAHRLGVRFPAGVTRRFPPP